MPISEGTATGAHSLNSRSGLEQCSPSPSLKRSSTNVIVVFRCQETNRAQKKHRQLRQGAIPLQGSWHFGYRVRSTLPELRSRVETSHLPSVTAGRPAPHPYLPSSTLSRYPFMQHGHTVQAGERTGVELRCPERPRRRVSVRAAQFQVTSRAAPASCIPNFTRWHHFGEGT